MAYTLNLIYKKLGLPRIILISLLIFVYILAYILKIPFFGLFENHLVRMGMNGILILAMAPAIISGVGMNFGLPLGIVCGIIGGLVSLEFNLRGFGAFFVAILIAIPLASLTGLLYGKLLNKVKGSEMMVATYTGFAITALMCIGWLILPFNNPALRWPIGKGLRVTISLVDSGLDKLLNKWLSFSVFGWFDFPTGLILFFLLMCLFMWIFLNTKTGRAMKAAGSNPKFAAATGINVGKQRILGTMLSTILGAIGIIVYAQSYGFFQLYTAPLMMAFPAVAGILIGGASSSKAKISQVILGAFIFQGLLVVSLPVANKLIPHGNLSEVMRVIIQYGIILYALTKAGGDK